MRAQFAEWLWRLAVLCMLAWIGWGLRLLHEDMNAPADEPTSVAQAPDDAQDSLDAIRDDLAGITQKIDAIMVVMARSR
jgi:hypothetical protein